MIDTKDESLDLEKAPLLRPRLIDDALPAQVEGPLGIPDPVFPDVSQVRECPFVRHEEEFGRRWLSLSETHPSSGVAKAALEVEGIGIVDLLAESGVASSKGDARRAVEGGGIYVNAHRVESVDATVSLGRAIEGRFLVLRKGKKSYHLVRVEG